MAIVPAPIMVPSPIEILFDNITDGSIIVANCTPLLDNFSIIYRRILAFPTTQTA